VNTLAFVIALVGMAVSVATNVVLSVLLFDKGRREDRFKMAKIMEKPETYLAHEQEMARIETEEKGKEKQSDYVPGAPLPPNEALDHYERY
jgi:hypothetical protein